MKPRATTPTNPTHAFFLIFVVLLCVHACSRNRTTRRGQAMEYRIEYWSNHASDAHPTVLTISASEPALLFVGSNADNPTTMATEAASARVASIAIRTGERRAIGRAAGDGTTSISGRPTASRSDVKKAASRPQSLQPRACWASHAWSRSDTSCPIAAWSESGTQRLQSAELTRSPWIGRSCGRAGSAAAAARAHAATGP